MEKLALITGGSSGLGLEIANNLGRKGYKIIILARDRGKLDNAVKELSDKGYKADGYQCDITEETQLKEVCKEIRQSYSKINFLVLNAGVVTVKLLSDFIDTRELKYDLEVNLWGTILSAYLFLPLLCEGSKILMISSGFGLMGAAGYSIYAASKAGIINFAEALRRELLCRKISVHVACPGDMDTPQFHEEHRNMPGWMKKGTPRGMMDAKLAAEKILKKCKGNKLLIIASFEISSLLILTKLIPRRLRDIILDKTFPTPK
jgi:short-subunit dehydrogenase